ncbi:hypothetical protein K6V78_09750 [Streptococcus gallolyticus]|nr:hypothetical protein [Streptococcus gallolyticus]MBY5041781.1 hypothetical protein [Streptococcus gallolyticus]
MKEGKQVQSVEEALENLHEAMAYASHDELVAAGLEKPKGFFSRVASFFSFLYTIILGLVALVVGVPLFLLYFIWNWLMNGVTLWIAYMTIGLIVITFADIKYEGNWWEFLATEPALYIVIAISGVLAFMMSVNKFRGKEI